SCSLPTPLSYSYTVSLHDALPISDRAWGRESAVYRVAGVFNVIGGWFFTAIIAFVSAAVMAYLIYIGGPAVIAVLLFVAVVLLRSEEHTSELQSRFDLVCRLLLEK